jgi:hypothetical protein
VVEEGPFTLGIFEVFVDAQVTVVVQPIAGLGNGIGGCTGPFVSCGASGADPVAHAGFLATGGISLEICDIKGVVVGIDQTVTVVVQAVTDLRLREGRAGLPTGGVAPRSADLDAATGSPFVGELAGLDLAVFIAAAGLALALALSFRTQEARFAAILLAFGPRAVRRIAREADRVDTAFAAVTAAAGAVGVIDAAILRAEAVIVGFTR